MSSDCVRNEGTAPNLAWSAKDLEERLSVVESGPSLTTSPQEVLSELKRRGGFRQATNAIIPPHVRYFTRFVTRSHCEKKAIGEYVADKLIPDGFRGFIQASTTTIPLGQRLATLSNRNTLIYTNSVVLPICALREDSKHQIHTFSGPIFDEFCGGWLVPVDDRDGHQRFCNLFKCDCENLKAAILAPMAIKPESGPFFVRQEMAQLSRAALRLADEIILLAPGSRIYLEGELEKGAPWNYGSDLTDWERIREKVTLVVAGTPRNVEIGIPEVLQLLAERHRIERVFWQDPTTGIWLSHRDYRERELANNPLASENLEAIGCATEMIPERLRKFLAPNQLTALGELWYMALNTRDELMDWLFEIGAAILSRQAGLRRAANDTLEALMEGVFEINRVLSAYEAAAKQHDGESVATSAQAAAELGVSRTALQKKCSEKFKLSTKHFKKPDVTLARLVMQSEPLKRYVLNLWLIARAEPPVDWDDFDRTI